MLWASGKVEPGNQVRLGQVGHVEDLDAFVVADVGVAELHLHRMRPLETIVAHDGLDLRMLGIVERDHHQAGVAADVGVGADNRDAPRRRRGCRSG